MQARSTATSPLVRAAGCAVVGVLLAATTASAITSEGCLASKRKAWGKLRACQAGVEAKQMLGAPVDPLKCATAFQTKIAKLSQLANGADVECRYVDVSGTILDHDTGLQWEKKGSADGVAHYTDPHDADNIYAYVQFIGIGVGFLDLLNDCGSGGVTGYDGNVTGGFAGHCDWRLPTVAELQSILAAPYPCGASPCIDPAFGATVGDFYWSRVILGTNTFYAWAVSYGDGNVLIGDKSTDSVAARAVRSAF